MKVFGNHKEGLWWTWNRAMSPVCIWGSLSVSPSMRKILIVVYQHRVPYRYFCHSGSATWINLSEISSKPQHYISGWWRYWGIQYAYLKVSSSNFSRIFDFIGIQSILLDADRWTSGQQTVTCTHSPVWVHTIQLKWAMSYIHFHPEAGNVTD